jgi:hypothetical protein
VSIASQEGSKIYFLVNKIAIAGANAQAATVYELNGALPDVVDTSDNSFQIDMSKLSSYLQGPRQVSINDLYTVMRPDPLVLMIRFSTGGATTQGGQVVFQVNSIDMIPPDGNAQTFTMSQPVSLVYDQSTLHMYTVGFSQMYDYFNTFVTNIQNNTYTTVVNNITIINVVTVTPPIFYPVVSPIVIPAPFPIYYPVPFPTVKPSITPKPTGSVTPKPTGSVTPKPTATLKPTTKPSLMPTGMPTATLKPTLAPTLKPTFKPTKASTFKPTMGGPTKQPFSTIKPVVTTQPFTPTARLPADGQKTPAMPTMTPGQGGIGATRAPGI